MGGVLFTPFGSNSNGDTTNLDGPYGYSSTGVSGDYATLVSHGLAHDGGPAFIQFNNLVPGAEYEATVVGSGLRVRSDCCQAGAGYNNMKLSGSGPLGTGTLEWPESDTSAKLIRGTFIADASRQQILNLNLFGLETVDPLTISANINAVVLSYTAVPEPGTVGLVMIGISAIATLRPRRSAC